MLQNVGNQYLIDVTCEYLHLHMPYDSVNSFAIVYDNDITYILLSHDTHICIHTTSNDIQQKLFLTQDRYWYIYEHITKLFLCHLVSLRGHQHGLV